MSELEHACELPGAPDAFQRLWTPHRMAYIKGESKPKDSSSNECPFCRAQRMGDADGLVVHRGVNVFVVMNLFPYNSGHLLVLPYRHVSMYTDLTPEERREFGEITAKAMRVVGLASNCDGYNLGMNQGDVAGAGIAAHLHQHIVPRWTGDANFFPIIAETKAIPQLLENQRRLLVQSWENVPTPVMQQGVISLKARTGDRRTARVIVRDSEGKVLLIRGRDEGYYDERDCFYVPGGQIEVGENAAQAAARELYEETSLKVDPAHLGDPVGVRRAEIDFLEAPIFQHEIYFQLQLKECAPDTMLQYAGKEHINGSQWLTPEQIVSIEQSSMRVFPSGLIELIK